MSRKTKKTAHTSGSDSTYLVERIGAILSGSNIPLYLLSALFLISFFIYYPLFPEDYDMWFHLRYGEQYVNNLTWSIDHSQFSWTPTRSSWKYVTWIGSSVLYLSYKMASFQGLYTMRLLTFIGVFALYLYYIKAIGEEFDINNLTALFLVTIALGTTAINIKPQLFTMLLFAAAVSIYFRCKSAPQYLFYIYPLLFPLWVNTHGGFIVGIVFITLALLGETFNYLFLNKENLPKRRLIHLAAAVALTYISICVNPHGASLPLQIFHTFSSKENRADFSQNIAEYASIWGYLSPGGDSPRGENTAWLLVIMAVLFLSLSIHLYRKKGYFDITVSALNLIFFIFGMNTARASLFFPLLWLFSISYLLTKGECLDIKKKGAVISLFIFVFFSIDVFYVTLRYNPVQSYFGEHIEEQVPLKAVEFVKKTGLPGPIFNDYLTGSYLLWSLYPDYKVFIDTRHRPYLNHAWKDMLLLKNDFQKTTPEAFASRYPFKTAIIYLKEGELLLWLLSSSEWKLAYFDTVAAVVVHKTVYDRFCGDISPKDFAPRRFRDVSNPAALERIFNFTLNRFGPDYAGQILDIYKRNVSNLYKHKAKLTESMEDAISRKKMGAK